METNKILKTLRTEKGLTQQELSERLKIGQATIACYENGQREPHIMNLIAYADFFECSIDYLVGRTDDFGNVIVSTDKTQYGKETLTKDEIELLSRYRKLTPIIKQRVLGFFEGLLATETPLKDK